MHRKRCLGILLVLAFNCVPARASGLEVTAGIEMGVSGGYFGVGPQIGATISGPAGSVLAFHDTLLLLPAGNTLGVNNQLTIGLGYSTPRLTLTAGGLLGFYRIPMCGRMLCGMVMGFAPGGFAQLDVFLGRFLGLSARGTIAWHGGESLVPSDELAWSATAGPIMRWQ